MGVCARRRSQMREMPPRVRMVATQLRRGFRKPRGGGGQVRSRVRSGEPGNAGRRPGMLARRRRERRPQRRVEPDDFAAIAFVPTVAVYLAVYLAV